MPHENYYRTEVTDIKVEDILSYLHESLDLFNISHDYKTRCESFIQSQIENHSEKGLDKYILSSSSYILDSKVSPSEARVYLSNFNFEETNEKIVSIYRAFKKNLVKIVDIKQPFSEKIAFASGFQIFNQIIGDISELTNIDKRTIFVFIFLVFAYAASNGNNFRDSIDE